MKCSRVTLVLVLVAITTTACSRRQPAPAETEEITVVPVAVEPAQRGRMRAVLHVSGIVTAAPDAEFLVIAPEAARILEITKAEGDLVAPGDVLVRFDLPTAAQEVSRQAAEVARLQAQVENARIAHARARDLVGRGLIARSDMDGAERELADAQAALGRAERAHATAEQMAARAIVRAPWPARVANRLHAPGDVVQAAATDPVLRLVDPRRLEIMATVPRADAARVVPGASARLAGGIEGREVRLSVTNAPNAADATPDGNVRVRLAFAEVPDLAIDSPVQVDIDAEERVDVVFVSPDALVQGGAETAVFIAAGNVAQRRRVTTGVANEQGIEITSGLQAGELVITRGQAGLADGAAISANPTTR